MRIRSLLLVVSLAAPSAAHGQQPAAEGVRRISLEDAIGMADRSSEAVEIARAAVTRARGQQWQARSQFLPQLNATASYSRTLASQFEGLSFGEPDSTSGGGGGGGDEGGLDFSSVGFGALNQWVLGLQFSQNVFTGGRASGLRTAANAGQRAAAIELTAQRAQLILDVTEAYYNAVLASRLAEIAETALAWNEDVLRQTTVARQVGSTSEFDLLRARVARDNQVPIVLQRRSDRNVATLRLKQLLEIPLDDSLVMTTTIDEPQAVAAVTTVAADATPDTSADVRATVRQAMENVEAREGMLRSARADRYPTISITSGYQRLFFPATTFPELSDYRENWTVGVSAAVSLLSGGRTRGAELQAQADLREARARLKQTRELAALDSRIALSRLEQAEATWRASQGTAEQARRAYSIDQIRYREGISTQTELTQSQLLVEQAMVNSAVAARDLAVARMRMALLQDLPLSAGSAAGAGGAGAGSATSPGGSILSAPPQQQQQPRTTSASSATGSNQ